jgi:hypothetical protein
MIDGYGRDALQEVFIFVRVDNASEFTCTELVIEEVTEKVWKGRCLDELG